MRVLWIINAPIPSGAAAVGIRCSHLATWIEAALTGLEKIGDVDVIVAFPHAGETLTAESVGSTSYITFAPVNFGDEKSGVEAFGKLLRRVRPGVVQISGTERGHALAAARACIACDIPFVVSLQGLSSKIAEHYTSGLPVHVSHGLSLRDLVRRGSVAQMRQKYRTWGRAEVETICLASHVIGRTTWDRAMAEQLNPRAQYHLVPETLRPRFYEHRWSLESCHSKSIFMSQGHYPIKGLHFALRALPLVLDRHPETQLFVSGMAPRGPGLRGRLKQTRYAAYLYDLIRAAGLRDRVHFVGVLGEERMVSQYLDANVFLSASTVENESNSLSEAKILGVPVVASYVGGVVDRIDHGRTGFFYQHDAPYMLAHYVNRLFDDPNLCGQVSEAGRRSSLELNNPAANARKLCAVYKAIAHGPTA